MANTLMDKLWVKPRQVCPTLKDEPWVKETPSVRVFLNEVHVAADVAGVVYVPLVDPSLEDSPIYLELKEDGDVYPASKLFSQMCGVEVLDSEIRDTHESMVAHFGDDGLFTVAQMAAEVLETRAFIKRRAEDAADGDELQRHTRSSTREPVAKHAKPTLKKVFGGSSGTSQPAPPTPVAQVPPKKFVKFDPQSQVPKRPYKLVRKGPSGVLDPEAVLLCHCPMPCADFINLITTIYQANWVEQFEAWMATNNLSWKVLCNVEEIQMKLQNSSSSSKALVSTAVDCANKLTGSRGQVASLIPFVTASGSCILNVIVLPTKFGNLDITPKETHETVENYT
ncbi:hypothetical protein BDR26DRAFT_940309 [Obelidium mucronatum]|nr:hypothetical protein BDR26DRAFT_940309 [Obelidium mucronatum]